MSYCAIGDVDYCIIYKSLDELPLVECMLEKLSVIKDSLSDSESLVLLFCSGHYTAKIYCGSKVLCKQENR